MIMMGGADFPAPGTDAGEKLCFRTESAFNIEHRCAHEQHQTAHQEREGMNEPEETFENRIVDVSVIDPVCGVAVNRVEARGKAQHEGNTYYFCSPGCMHKFVSSPTKYLAAVQQAAITITPAPTGPFPICSYQVNG